MSKKIAEKYISENNIKLDDKYQALIDMLSPNFGYLPIFTKYIYTEKISLKRVSDLNTLIKNYKQLLKNRDINPLEYDSFEALDDKINNEIIRNNNLKFAKKFVSNKYKHLLNEESISMFGELMKLEDDYSKIQKYLASKLAAYKSPNDLISGIDKVVDMLSNPWNSISYAEQVKNKGGIIEYIDENTILAFIPTYKVSNKLGSPNWCISRSNGYWKQYVKTDSKQYFFYDFSKNRNDRHALIGATIDMYGNITNIHDYYNSSMYRNAPKLLKDNVTKLCREDILEFIKGGRRVTNDILSSYDIDRETVLEFNSHYFTKVSDMFTLYDNGDITSSELLTYGKSRSRDIYLRVLEVLPIDSTLESLKNKFVLNDIVLKRFVEYDMVDIIYNTFGNKLRRNKAFKELLLSDDCDMETFEKYSDVLMGTGIVIVCDKDGRYHRYSNIEYDNMGSYRSLNDRVVGELCLSKVGMLFKNGSAKVRFDASRKVSSDSSLVYNSIWETEYISKYISSLLHKCIKELGYDFGYNLTDYSKLSGIDVELVKDMFDKYPHFKKAVTKWLNIGSISVEIGSLIGKEYWKYSEADSNDLVKDYSYIANYIVYHDSYVGLFANKLSHCDWVIENDIDMLKLIKLIFNIDVSLAKKRLALESLLTLSTYHYTDISGKYHQKVNQLLENHIDEIKDITGYKKLPYFLRNE